MNQNTGCPYRGTMTCWRCTFEPVVECDYQCVVRTNDKSRIDCEDRYRCKCGWDQTGTLAAMGLVT